VRTLLQDSLPAQQYGRALLSASVQPPVVVATRGNTVCTCWGVTDTAIHASLQQIPGDATQRLAALQARLQCGTNCGSCLPQLQRMVRATAPAATAV
jgi:assimilatory nitrate reductase catalytic subunit